MGTKDGKCETEMLERTGKAKTTFNNMKKILSNMIITMKLQIRLRKRFVWPVLMYGCEVWTLDKILKRRVKAMEMCILRRMMRVSWTARVTNERVMEMAGVARELMGAVRRRQLKCLGYLPKHDCLGKDVFLGKIEGRKTRGRRRIKFSASLVEDNPGEMTVAGLHIAQ